MTLSNAIFLTLFLTLATLLAISIASYRFTTYQIALKRGLAPARVWQPFWLR